MNKRKLNSELIHHFKKQNNEKVKELILSGGDVNAKYRQGRTWLLKQSYARCDKDMIKFLIEHGADPTMSHVNGKNVLYYTLKGKIRWDAELTSYFSTYNIQKLIIDKYPHAILYFKEYNALNDDIKNEYQHLISAYELNLF